MKKFLLILPIILITIFGMISCANNEEDVPEGLQVVKISEEDGYKFYGPEGWVIANDGDIAASYVSKINRTSITFVKAKAPEGSIEEYFDAEKSKFSYEIEVLEPNKATKFGNAEKACSYVYTFEYDESDISMDNAVMQIFIWHGEDFYIFTYTSTYTGYDSPAEEESEYQRYMEIVRKSIDAFKFIDKTEVGGTSNNSNEFVLVSDKKIAGFELYLPKSAEVVMSSAQVAAKLSDKANINITTSTTTGISSLEYLHMRKEELEELFGTVTDIKIEYVKALSDGEKDTYAEILEDFDKDITADPDIKFGDLDKNSLASYEYTYTYNGTLYHVYQIIGVDTFNGYVFTYTATEDEYSMHLGTVDKILEKVIFK